ncbi:unnamed protein product, partial [Prunus brigantina]
LCKSYTGVGDHVVHNVMSVAKELFELPSEVKSKASIMKMLRKLAADCTHY